MTAPMKPENPAKPDAPLRLGAMAAASPTPFQLSRIYAKGWIAGSRSDIEPGNARAMVLLNPYEARIERDKWQQGFKEAMARRIRL